MVRAEWRALAMTLALLRSRLVRKWSGPTCDPEGAYAQMLLRGGVLHAFDEIARTIAEHLCQRSSRFSARQFLELAGVDVGVTREARETL